MYDHRLIPRLIVLIRRKSGNSPQGQHPFTDVNAPPRPYVQPARRAPYAARPMRPFTITTLTVLLAATALSACGGSDDKQTTTAGREDQGSILATVDALQTASRAGDGATVCSRVFTTSLVHSIERASKRSCAREVKQNLFKPNAVFSLQRSITVNGDTGTALIRERNGNVSTLHVVQQGGVWRINRVTPAQ